MQRRTIRLMALLALGLLFAPLSPQAQPPAKVPRIGVLATYDWPPFGAFRQGLRDLGYVEGQNLVMEYRWTEGKNERFPALAAELVERKVDVIVTWGTPAAKAAKHAARALGVQLQPVEVAGDTHFAGAFDTMTRERADALIVAGDTVFVFHRTRLAELAAQHRLPAIYLHKEHAHAGGLMAYSASYPDLFRRAASYVDKILKDTKPADLPVEQPTKFELVLNLKTAQILGLTIPPTLLFLADEVIRSGGAGACPAERSHWS